MNLEEISSPFLESFPGDFSGNLMQRQTSGVLFCTVSPVGFSEPKLLAFNESLSEKIGLGKFEVGDLDFLVGNYLQETVKTYATAYAGHQFGSWAGQLGDGRAIFAGEIQNSLGGKTELQWKGAGATPYSRTADGRAVLRSSVREYLMSEAMYHLGVPTTRALSLCLTGEDVIRDILYDGHPKPEKGAVVMRTAESFLRFGHFELLSAQKENELLQRLVDFTIENYYPEIISEGIQKYKDFFEQVARRTADLMVEWFRVGFVHGVMNTDNMSVLGLTIDYGPFAMLEDYDLNFTSNTTDIPSRRYAFGKQGQISQWNLWQLANALFPLIRDEAFLEQVLNDYSSYFWEEYDKMMLRKFGLDDLKSGDEEFFTEWQKLMETCQFDYALFFNEIENLESINYSTFFDKVSYSEFTPERENMLRLFLEKFKIRKSQNIISDQDSLTLMQQNNPKFILRNYLLFECINELELGNDTLFNRLWEALQNPYEEVYPEFSLKRPEKYNDTPGCSALSCSS